MNYDGSIKALLFLLNNDCCTSIDKSRKFLSDLTAGKLNISKGMINGLCKEFRVPDTNNEAECRLRSYKRKQKQAVSFRSIETVDHLCKSMSMLVMMRENNENIYNKVSQIFG